MALNKLLELVRVSHSHPEDKVLLFVVHAVICGSVFSAETNSIWSGKDTIHHKSGKCA